MYRNQQKEAGLKWNETGLKETSGLRFSINLISSECLRLPVREIDVTCHSRQMHLQLLGS